MISDLFGIKKLLFNSKSRQSHHHITIESELDIMNKKKDITKLITFVKVMIYK